MMSKHCLPILYLTCSLTLLVSTLAPAKILFYSSRTGNHEIYTMNDDGSHIQRITDNPLADVNPRWSPDGSKIVFERAFTHENRKIFIMDADGRNEHQLTDTPADYRRPAWHPDGNYIAFSVRQEGKRDLSVMNLKTGKVKQLTNNPKDGLSENPDWAPNGRQLVFEHRDEFGRNIWTIAADGRHQKRRSPPSQDASLFRYRPRWAPDGVHILYPEAEYRGPGFQGGLVAMRLIVQNVLTGTREVHPLPKGFLVSTVSWMADGRAVLFSASNRNVNTVDVLYRFPLASRKLIPLTNPLHNYYVSDWKRGKLYVSPKGQLTTLWARLKQAD